MCSIKTENHTSEEKGKKNRKREGEREEEKGKKLWLHNCFFTLESLTEEVYFSDNVFKNPRSYILVYQNEMHLLISH